ncbi:MAG TPA: hypothetical protein VIC57_11830, partial [Candidatus Dormibacteraeota bacterium]
LDRFWQAGPELAELRVQPWTATDAADAAVRQLGPTGVTLGGVDLADWLAAASRALAADAQRRAMGE